MASNPIETGSPPPSSEVPASSAARFSRRRFLQGAAAIGLGSATNRIFGSQAAEAANVPDILPNLTAELISDKAVMRTGPGGTTSSKHPNVGYDKVTTLAPSSLRDLKLDATYGKFARGTAIALDTDGQPQTFNGWLAQKDVKTTEDLSKLRKLKQNEVPWEPTRTVDEGKPFIQQGPAGDQTTSVNITTDVENEFKAPEDSPVRIHAKVNIAIDGSEGGYDGISIWYPGDAEYKTLSLVFQGVADEGRGRWILYATSVEYEGGSKILDDDVAPLNPDDPRAVDILLQFDKTGTTLTQLNTNDPSETIKKMDLGNSIYDPKYRLGGFAMLVSPGATTEIQIAEFQTPPQK